MNYIRYVTDLYLFLPISRESIVFGSSFWKRDLHVFRSHESENHIFSAWSVCMHVCVSVISIAQKKLQHDLQIWHSKSVSSVNANWFFFYKVWIKTLFTGSHKRILKHNCRVDGISCWWILVHLDCTKYNEIKIYIWYAHKYVTNRIW